MEKVLISLSGARPKILEQCPTERLKFQSLGWAILITSGMATVSMWFALSSVLGLNVAVALLGALVWGLIIMGIDRWLITSMPTGSGRRWAIAAPRLLLAILLGTLISTPIVLRVFQSEINAQIAVIKADRANAYLQQQQKSPVNAQVAFWTKDVSNLQKVITSNGQVPINPASDPAVKSLTAQRAAELKLQQGYYNQWQCQLYGGAGCSAPKGNGPLAQASHANYVAAVAQVAALNTKIAARESQLQATDAQSRTARLQEAKGALPAAKAQLALATSRKTKLQATFDAQNESTNGLLIRLEALNQLTGQGFTLNAARILIFLLFLVIECLPVTVKAFQQPGNYERILEAARAREFKDADRAYKMRPQSSAPGPVSAGAGPAAAPGRRARPGARDADIRDLWRPGRDMPTTTWSGASPPPPEPGRAADPDESGEYTRLDDKALREMENLRAEASQDGGKHADAGQNGSGGIELRYGDDDL